ncbi:sulfatase family protein [Sediminitomix flava]|uniref:Arylsulfatase A-like enzyme n=1 Tax=Sediminitomix flava TaxID=379075 RepID=A0A315Z4I0_SEDFL|nr:sulfatase [Sediminitomix flava]PWJ37928.1 arylsulfatase A-like enzyme [Sediminitomix flava]
MKKFILFSISYLLPYLLFAQQQRPNIVWLTTEDNSASWYRLYNPEHGAPMPNIEKLAEHGIVFNNAYSNAPVCSTARSTIISGLYGPKIGAHYHRAEQKVKMPKGLKLFPYYLRQAGYYTTNNSKQDYNFVAEDVNGVWDESSRKASFRNREENQPFFHVQNFYDTHEGQMFGELKEGIEDIGNPSEVELFPYHPDTDTFRKKYAQYISLNHYVDKKVGRLIQQLEDDGLLDDTFIFHYGDHGGVLPGGKGYAHNDGLQVAMVVHVPKNWKHLSPVSEGSRVDGFVEFVDLSATVLNLAGIKIPDLIDGKPFLGKGVSIEKLAKRDETFGYADRFDEKYDMVRFLRKGKYSYWRSYQPFNFDGLHNSYRYKQEAFREWRALAKKGKLNDEQLAFYHKRLPEQLFDLENDPHEVNNLALDPAYASVLLEMRKLMHDRVSDMPDLSFYPESFLLKGITTDGVSFGQEHKTEIRKLIDIADLQLQSFAMVKKKIGKALNSKNNFERYWALINCSVFGEEANQFYSQAEEMAKNDTDIFVRMRAAEFLGLTGRINPKPLLLDILEQCPDQIAANLVLNTIVLLSELTPMKLTLNDLDQSKWKNVEGNISNRFLYLRELANSSQFLEN